MRGQPPADPSLTAGLSVFEQKTTHEVPTKPSRVLSPGRRSAAMKEATAGLAVRGEFWWLKMQIMPFEEAKTYRINPFDLTKVWPHRDYPLQEVGKLVLDRNFTDHHTEIEQAAVRAQQPGAGHWPVAGQDAVGPKLRLRRCASGPAGCQLQADPGQRAQV